MHTYKIAHDFQIVITIFITFLTTLIVSFLHFCSLSKLLRLLSRDDAAEMPITYKRHIANLLPLLATNFLINPFFACKFALLSFLNASAMRNSMLFPILFLTLLCVFPFLLQNIFKNASVRDFVFQFETIFELGACLLLPAWLMLLLLLLHCTCR